MNRTIRRVTDVVEQQAETYRYWQSRSSAERFEATWELSRALYGQFYKMHPVQTRQAGDGESHGKGPTRPFIRLQRP